MLFRSQPVSCNQLIRRSESDHSQLLRWTEQLPQKEQGTHCLLQPSVDQPVQRAILSGNIVPRSVIFAWSP